MLKSIILLSSICKSNQISLGSKVPGRAPVTSSALSSGPDIGNPSTVPNQFIVVLKDQSNVDTVYAMANEMISPSGYCASILDVYDSTIKGFTVSVSDQQDFNSLANDPRVAFVEQDRVVYGQQFFSNDPQQYESESLEMLPSKVTRFNQQLQRQVLDPLFPVVPQDQSAPIPSVELPYVHTQQQLQQHPLLPPSILPPQLEQPIFIPQQLNEQSYSTLQQQEQLLQQQQDQGQGQQQQQQQSRQELIGFTLLF